MFQIKQFQNAINPINTARLKKFIDTEATNATWTAAQYLGNSDGAGKISFLLKYFYETNLPNYFFQQTGYFPWVTLNFLTIRKQHHTDSGTLTNWHIDDNFFGGNTLAMTAWFATEDCGKVRPGLDFALIDNKEKWDAFVAMLTTKPLGERRFLDSELEEYLGKFETITPLVRSGDAMVFGKYVVHRTQAMSGEFLPRASIEFRMAALETFKADDRRAIYLARIRNGDGRKILEHTRIGTTKINQVYLDMAPAWEPG